MKKRILSILLLALLLASAVQPAAFAAGLPELADLEPGPEGSLRNEVNEETESVNIRGTEVPIESVVFLDFGALEEPMQTCVGEVPEDAMIQPVDELPPGLCTDIRKESVRAHEEALAAVNAEHIMKEEPLEETRRLGVPEDENLDREAWYLYLEGVPAQTGCYLFFLWAGDGLYLCSQDILEELPDKDEAEPEAPSVPEPPTWEPEPVEIPEPPAPPEPEEPEELWVNAPVEWNEVPAIEAIPQPEEPETPETPETPEVPEVPEVPETPAEPENGDDSFVDATTFTQSPDSAPAYDPFAGQSVGEPIFYFPEEPVTQPSFPQVTETPLSPLTVSIVGITECRPGDQVVLSAYVSGSSGAVSYQWYYSSGPYSGFVDGANDGRILADTSRAGSVNYFCLVTDQMGRQALSEPLTLNVVERQARSISIESMPVKTEYYEGNPIDTTGLRLLVRYDDGTVGHVSEGFTISPESAVYTGAASQNVIVTYNGASVAFPVVVRSMWDAVRSIAVLNLPNKTSYYVGDTLDTTGLVLRIYAQDGGYIDMDRNFTCSPTHFDRSGGQVITVSFGNKTCTFSVSVQEEDRVLGISLLTLPANRSYRVGDAISTSGLSLQVRTNRGYETVTSGFTYTPRVATAAGTQTITVLYGGQSATFTVEVSASVAPTPTPRASALPTYTPAPTRTPTPSAGIQASATPRPTTAPARRNTGVGSVVKVLFVVALLALAALIFIVLYLRRQDKKENTRARTDAARTKRGR